jgi:hypothetical protein
MPLFRESVRIGPSGLTAIPHPVRITLDGERSGEIMLTDTQQRQSIHLDGGNATAEVGTQGINGNILVRDSLGRDVCRVDGNGANLHLGTNGNEGDIFISNSSGTDTIRLNGQTGDITLSGADCAESFETSESEPPEPGTVMVIDEEGRLRQSTSAYDRRAAGVISGAGTYRPGIILDGNFISQRGNVQIALSGKVYCKADSRYSQIEVGDLLTTSDTPGHAMKAGEPEKAFGTVIGKALRRLSSGKGLIPILVCLQ